MVCTRNTTTSTASRVHAGPTIIALVLLLVGCAGNGTPRPTPTAAVVVPPVATATPSAPGVPTDTPPPTLEPALEALLAPGPSYSAPPRVFFRHGDDLWQLPANGEPAPVTNRLRIGPFAASPDGGQVAVVIYTRERGEDLQEVRILNAAGETQAVTVERTLATPAIVAIAWSWDAAWLALGWDDGALAIVPAGPAVGPVVPFNSTGNPGNLVRLEWAPNNAGLIWLSASALGNSLVVTPLGGDRIVLADASATPARPVRSFAWLPGRGRIAYVEGTAAATGAPSSIHTILPDGTARELLVSAGQFGPVSYIEDLTASPDGHRLAFTVFMPDTTGSSRFTSLWVLNIDSGDLDEVRVPGDVRVTDLWWISSGLLWRGVDIATPAHGSPAEYSGIGAFILGVYSFDSLSSEIVLRATGE